MLKFGRQAILWEMSASNAPDGSTQMQLLAKLGRRRYISISALSSVIDEIRQHGLPDSSSRSSIKRARNEFRMVDTRYGSLFRTIPITLDNKTKPWSLMYIHPAAMLVHLTECCKNFSDVFLTQLRTQPSDSPARPWHLLVYTDEVTPGDQLRRENRKKIWVIYWSFKEFGPALLSSEFMWFTWTAIRSDLVSAHPGGISSIIKKMLLTFMEPESNFITAGINLMFHKGGERHLHALYATGGYHVADGDAIKKVLGVKGASGSLPCFACRNATAHKADLAGRGSAAAIAAAGTNLVPATELDMRKYSLHTDGSIIENARYLQAMHGTVTQTHFKETEQFLGLNHEPDGILLCKEITDFLPPITGTMYDWMHTYVSTGIFQHEVGRLVDILKSERVGTTIHDFLQTFVWPQQVRSMSGHTAFRKKREKKASQDSAPKFSCSAAESLNLFPVLREYLNQHQTGFANPRSLLACESFYRLCKVLSLLILQGRVSINTAVLEAAIIDHLSVYKLLGEEEWIPKNHWALHLSQMHAKHGWLTACFTHERKHKEIKRTANEMDNTSSDYEESILSNSIYLQVRILDEELQVPPTAPVLLHPKKAEPHLATAVLDALDLDMCGEEIMVSKEVLCPPLNRFTSGDVVCIKTNSGGVDIGKIEHHVCVLDICVSIVSLWQPLGNNIFQMRDEKFDFVDANDLMASCIYKVLPAQQALVLQPVHEHFL